MKSYHITQVTLQAGYVTYILVIETGTSYIILNINYRITPYITKHDPSKTNNGQI